MQKGEIVNMDMRRHYLTLVGPNILHTLLQLVVPLDCGCTRLLTTLMESRLVALELRRPWESCLITDAMP